MYVCIPYNTVSVEVRRGCCILGDWGYEGCEPQRECWKWTSSPLQEDLQSSQTLNQLSSIVKFHLFISLLCECTHARVCHSACRHPKLSRIGFLFPLCESWAPNSGHPAGCPLPSKPAHHPWLDRRFEQRFHKRRFTNENVSFPSSEKGFGSQANTNENCDLYVPIGAAGIKGNAERR